MGDLTRFNKSAIQSCTFHVVNGQKKHWIIESPTMFSTMYYLSFLDISQLNCLDIFPLFALTQASDSLFNSFITLRENEYFHIP